MHFAMTGVHCEVKGIRSPCLATGNSQQNILDGVRVVVNREQQVGVELGTKTETNCLVM